MFILLKSVEKKKLLMFCYSQKIIHMSYDYFFAK